MRLARNFTYHEAIRSQTAARHGIDNTPNQKQLRNMIYTAMVMQQIRNYFGNPVQVTSFFRCPELNTAIRGSKNSAHMDGRACDFVVNGVSNNRVFDLLKESDIPFKKLINEFPNESRGWLHIEVAEFAEPTNKSFLLAIKNNGKTQYLNA